MALKFVCIRGVSTSVRTVRTCVPEKEPDVKNILNCMT